MHSNIFATATGEDHPGKKANAISYGMLSILMLGLISWIAYGVIKTDYPIIVTNGLSLALNILIVIFTIKYKTSTT